MSDLRSPKTPCVGTLGSELTFAGQATKALQDQYPEWVGPVYLPTMDDVADAVLEGRIDLGVLTSETSHTACTDTAARILAGESLFVTHEIVVPYHCALLVKPGARLADITHVGGHGSIRQCRRFLAERLPAATVTMHRQNSAVAAREVLAGDGSSAVIGTTATAVHLGLEILEHDVDQGSVGGWWALARSATVTAGADHAAVRVEGSDELQRIFELAGRLDLALRTVTNAPTGELFRYRYLAVLRTRDGAQLPAEFVEPIGSSLVGAFSTATAV